MPRERKGVMKRLVPKMAKQRELSCIQSLQEGAFQSKLGGRRRRARFGADRRKVEIIVARKAAFCWAMVLEAMWGVGVVVLVLSSVEGGFML
jgi:hypothetical protein